MQLSPQLQDWQARGKTRDLLGYEVFTIVEPDNGKPILLLIHGYPTASWDFAEIWPLLSVHFRLVTLDMLGFGFSAKPPTHNYTIHEQADIVEAFIGELQLDAYHILAHDYGDTVAQELLARQNSGSGAGRWLSVCFLNGGLFPETHKAIPMQRLLLGPLGKWLNQLSGKRQFDRAINRVFGPNTQASQQKLDQFWQLICYHGGDKILYRLIKYMRDRITHRQRWVEALQQSCVPVALINGSADPVSGAHMVARYQQLNCRLDFLAQLPGIGHWPQLEASTEVATRYLEFAKSLD